MKESKTAKSELFQVINQLVQGSLELAQGKLYGTPFEFKDEYMMEFDSSDPAQFMGIKDKELTFDFEWRNVASANRSISADEEVIDQAVAGWQSDRRHIHGRQAFKCLFKNTNRDGLVDSFEYEGPISFEIYPLGMRGVRVAITLDRRSLGLIEAKWGREAESILY